MSCVIVRAYSDFSGQLFNFNFEDGPGRYEATPEGRKDRDYSYMGKLTHCILLDSSTVICWMSSFVILGVPDLFYCFYSTFDGKSC